jgi:hypothetical protein
MVTYIYFVKCPNCEDEHFDFFDDAKDFALGRLSQKPIITQTEVCRNDFGECTDSADLGTVWSWEDMMKEADSEETVFSKDETFGISEGLDDFDDFDIGPQIDEFDNSLDFDDGSTDILWVAENLAGGDIVAACWADSESTANNILAAAFRERTGGDPKDCYIYQAETSDVEYVNANPELLAESQERKPIPDGMTIEQLVEEMEENEDTVECAWCEDLFAKSECRKEVDLGWLCGRCEAAIKSRGEPLTFIENTYWDFLDEDAEAPAEKKSWEYDPNGDWEFTTYDDYDNEVTYTVPQPEVIEALATLIDDEYVQFQTEETDELRTVQALKDAGKVEEFLIDGFDTHISNYITELDDYFEQTQNENREAAIEASMAESDEDEGPGGGAFGSWDEFWRWKEG